MGKEGRDELLATVPKMGESCINKSPAPNKIPTHSQSHRFKPEEY